MSNKHSNAAVQIANAIEKQFPNIRRTYPRDQILNSSESFVQEWFRAALNAGTPSKLADTPPGKTEYPDRENPAPVRVPDPAETESAPDGKQFPEYLRFTNALLAVSQSGKKLFDAEESNGGPDSDERRDARNRALDDVEELRSSIYGL